MSKYENSSVSFEAFEQQFSTSVARRLAMHLVASKPLFLSKKDATSAFVESEKAIFLEQMGDSDKKKPKEVQDRILQGKLNKRLSDVCFGHALIVCHSYHLLLFICLFVLDYIRWIFLIGLI